MIRYLLAAAAAVSLLACVPKSQYRALTAERDDLRAAVSRADSLSDARAQRQRDSLAVNARREREDVRRLETVMASNRTLHDELTELRTRYNTLLEQQGDLVDATTAAGTRDHELTQRAAALAREQDRLQQRERELAAREESLSSYDAMRRDQPGVDTLGTSPVAPEADARLRADRLFDELRQLLPAATPTGYVLRRDGPTALEVTLAGDLLFDGGRGVSLQGQRLLRRLAATLGNYPAAEYTIVGHALPAADDDLLPYQSSTARSIRVALQLSQFGLDPTRMVAGGMGDHGGAAPDNMSGTAAAERTDIRISFPR